MIISRYRNDCGVFVAKWMTEGAIRTDYHRINVS